MSEINIMDQVQQKVSHSEVLLNFPHNGSIFVGNVSKTGIDRFYHKETDKEVIDMLLAPKVFHRFKKFERNKHYVPHTLNNENLLIKGNNLFALYSLLRNYESNIKFIYIDPPYNTGSDSFKYNDQLNRSTYLTFMKNRLEVAWKLLEPSGCIAVQCSFHEYAYLKVLMDNLFGQAHEVVTFNCLVRHPDRSITADKEFNDVVEYILIYSKSTEFRLPKREKEKTIDEYIYNVRFHSKPDEILQFEDRKVEVFYPTSYEVEKLAPNEKQLKSISIRGSIKEKNSSGRFYVKHLERLKEQYPPLTLFKVPNIGDDHLDYRLIQLPKKGNKNGSYFQGMPQSSTVTKIPYPNFLDYVHEYNNVNSEGIVEFRNGKKPEALMQFLIELLSDEHDIVLDFFAGSGTTAAVAHKLNRKFIAIEQMDFIGTITLERLKAVLKGEQTGISKDIGWTGGGSFVYMELMPLHEQFIEKINLKNKATLLELLTMNQLYLNFEHIEEEAFVLSEKEIDLNKQFYNSY